MLSTAVLRRCVVATRSQRRHHHHGVMVFRRPTRRHPVVPALRVLRQQQPSRTMLSTAPRPNMSYEEWLAQKTREMQRTAASSTSRGADGGHTETPKSNNLPHNRLKPSKSGSLVFLPDHLALTWSSNKRHKKRSSEFQLNCLDFAIAKPGRGGHVVLGPNGSGKSLLVEYLSHPDELLAPLANDNGDMNDMKLLHDDQVAYVSFDSHVRLVHENPRCSVHDFIATGGAGRGTLSKAARYLVVRFGLKQLLHRSLATLSTGEIRKCLLVGALSRRPRLLVLENPFDGLDPRGRAELRSIASKAIRGLDQSGKLLVQHVDAAHVPPAQVLLSTHRPEEILEGVSTVSWTIPPSHQDGGPARKSSASPSSRKGRADLVTISRPTDHSQEQIMYMALGLDKDHNKCKRNWSTLAPWQDDDPTLPSVEDIQQVWNRTNNNNTNNNNTLLLEFDNVMIRRRRDGPVVSDGDFNDDSEEEFATLLHPLSWKIQKGQRWLIAGGNGAGKSTLSRFLLQSSNNNSSNSNDNNDNEQKTSDEDDDCARDLPSGTYSKDPSTTIGWVSTESHLGQIRRSDDGDHDSDAATTTTTSAWDVICHNGAVPDSVAESMVSWLFAGGAGSSGDHNVNKTMLQERSLQELSQGQQKLALIASALAMRPNLLILDEPTQGLDWVNRRRVLALLERICQAKLDNDMSLVFITHYEEEWIPSISHVLHLDRGHVVYQGPKKGHSAAATTTTIRRSTTSSS